MFGFHILAQLQGYVLRCEKCKGFGIIFHFDLVLVLEGAQTFRE